MKEEIVISERTKQVQKELEKFAAVREAERIADISCMALSLLASLRIASEALEKISRLEGRNYKTCTKIAQKALKKLGAT